MSIYISIYMYIYVYVNIYVYRERERGRERERESDRRRESELPPASAPLLDMHQCSRPDSLRMSARDPTFVSRANGGQLLITYQEVNEDVGEVICGAPCLRTGGFE